MTPIETRDAEFFVHVLCSRGGSMIPPDECVHGVPEEAR